MSTQTISPKELYQLITQGNAINLIDVRSPAEYQEIHVDIAKNIPLDRLNNSDLGLDSNSKQPLYVICRSGARGSQACQSLLRSGLSNVVNVEGGTMAWANAGLPVTRGKKTVSLNRQVQMTVGSLVLVTSALALIHDPRWALLSALMGAGLLYAGAFDSCMMGMCLAKMPWNQPTKS
jgi:rhodanese-related sulfurtransferase